MLRSRVDDSHDPIFGEFEGLRTRSELPQCVQDARESRRRFGPLPVTWTEPPTVGRGVTEEIAAAWRRDERPDLLEGRSGQLLDWGEARLLLDWEWRDDYGSSGEEDCPPIWCWTKNWVIFVTAYDTATAIRKLPRNPSNEDDPWFVGGTNP